MDGPRKFDWWCAWVDTTNCINVSKAGKMKLSKVFHKETTQPNGAVNSTVGDAELSADSSVAEWLAHPVGGAIFRKMLHDAGQNEAVLRPVRRMPLRRLVALSRGKFSEELMEDMVARANAGQMPEAPASPQQENSAPESDAAITLPEWEEAITPNRFTGKTVVITGAGSGIGRATASRVAREGGKVVAVDISKERLDEFVTSLPGTHIAAVVGDITKEQDIKKITDAVGGRIDALANVAGIMDNMTPLHEVTDDVWDRVLAVNLTGMMKLTRAVLPLMLKNNRGSIVNVGSEASLRGSAAGAAYTASKHAVIGLTKNSAYMYGPSGIRINAIAPGAVMTNIEARFDSKLGEQRVNAALTLMPDAATPEELAASICFLLSDDAVNINGTVLASDGGWSAQ